MGKEPVVREQVQEAYRYLMAAHLCDKVVLATR
jgi:hypothetical protein